MGLSSSSAAGRPALHEARGRSTPPPGPPACPAPPSPGPGRGGPCLDRPEATRSGTWSWRTAERSSEACSCSPCVASSPRRAGPRASCSWRITSLGSAPPRRLSSRCSRMASSSNPMRPKPYLSGPPRFLGIAIKARNAPRACQGAGSGPAPLRTLGGLIVRQAPVASRSDYTWPYRAFAMRGAIAQLGERLDRTQEVGGSSPPSSIHKVPAKSQVLMIVQAGSKGGVLLMGPFTGPITGGAAVIWRLGDGRDGRRSTPRPRCSRTWIWTRDRPGRSASCMSRALAGDPCGFGGRA